MNKVYLAKVYRTIKSKIIFLCRIFNEIERIAMDYRQLSIYRVIIYI